MNHSDIAHQRLISQHIAYHKHETPLQVVQSLGAMQAQDYTNALWAVGLRAMGATRASVEAAIANKEIVRTWPMRGTLHFVPAADVRWMLELMTPRVLSGAAARERSLQLSHEDFAQAFGVLEKALHGGKPMLRTQLLQVLENANIVTANQRGYHIIWRAAQQGLICLGPMQGKQPTFVWLDAWLPPAKKMSRDEVLATIVSRYLTGHAPATVKDMMTWAGLPQRDILVGLATVRSHFISEDIDGVTYWMRPDQPSFDFDRNQAVLLPAFDEYLLGYRDRTAVINADHLYKVVPGGNGVFLPTIVIGGQMLGIWKRTFKAKEIAISLIPFDRFTARQLAAITTAAQAYGDFYGLPVSVKIAEV